VRRLLLPSGTTSRLYEVAAAGLGHLPDPISFELGLILLFFPWRSSWISMDSMHEPRLARIWMSGYFRGALNGLGLLNIYVALSEPGVKSPRCFALRSPRPGSLFACR